MPHLMTSKAEIGLWKVQQLSTNENARKSFSSSLLLLLSFLSTGPSLVQLNCSLLVLSPPEKWGLLWLERAVVSWFEGEGELGKWVRIQSHSIGWDGGGGSHGWSVQQHMALFLPPPLMPCLHAEADDDTALAPRHVHMNGKADHITGLWSPLQDSPHAASLSLVARQRSYSTDQFVASTCWTLASYCY